MSTMTEWETGGLHLAGVQELRKRWGWFLGLGILLIILGIVALSYSLVATLASMIFFGWLLIVGGVFQAAHGFTCKGWSGFFLDMLSGLLYIAVGFMMVSNPAASALALTLLIALFLMFAGIFRMVVAFSVAYQNRLWIFLHGMISLLLGVLVWRQWPTDGLWVIGMFIGIDMLFNGWSLVMLGIAARNVPDRQPPAAA